MRPPTANTFSSSIAATSVLSHPGSGVMSGSVTATYWPRAAPIPRLRPALSPGVGSYSTRTANGQVPSRTASATGRTGPGRSLSTTTASKAIQVYSQGNPQEAVALVRTAQDATARNATPRVKSMLHARAARALSKTGEHTACQHELDAARTEYALGPHDDDPPWSYWLNEGEIEMLAGSSALDLHDPRRALTHFDQARHVQYAADGYVRDHVLYLTRTARAHLQTGDLDAACAVATNAFTQNTTLNSSRPSDALDDLRDELTPHRQVRVVQDFLQLSA